MGVTLAVDKREYRYVILSATGGGEVVFRAHKPHTIFRVRKVTVETQPSAPIPSSGRIVLYRGTRQHLTSIPIARRMEASGDEALYVSEFLTAVIESGPASTEMKFTFFYDEEAEL